MPYDYRLKILFILIAAAVVAVFNLEPITQDLNYHRFADQRTLFGISQLANVLSNLPFIVIGLMGMRRMVISNRRCWLASLKPLYFIFFTGVLLTGFGSSYYHFHPDNKTLLWDRLPMTIAFMAFFSAIVGEYISVRWALKLVIPLLVIGLISVMYWQVTEQSGCGDLRLYALVQFLPMILIPVILWLYVPIAKFNSVVWGLIAAYALSKIAEFYDAAIYSFLGMLSGHTIKHLFAAFGVLIIYRALRNREGELNGRS